MPRDSKIYLEDILESILKIRQFTTGFDAAAFKTDPKTFDAVIRNLEIIGEAAKNLPESKKVRCAGVDWRKIAGLRDILAHQYFGIDAEIVWDIVQHKLIDLEKCVRQLLAEDL